MVTSFSSLYEIPVIVLFCFGSLGTAGSFRDDDAVMMNGRYNLIDFGLTAIFLIVCVIQLACETIAKISRALKCMGPTGISALLSMRWQLTLFNTFSGRPLSCPTDEQNYQCEDDAR